MNIKTIAALSAGAIGTAATAFGPTVAAFAYPAQQQGPTVFMAPPTNSFGRGNRMRIPTINWSYADSRPGVAPGQATGLYIWHDRNTVHVESTDNHWFGDDFRGSIEIVGGKFDNIYNEHDKADTRFTLVNPNRLLFHFNAKDGDVDGFKFNIHGGRRLIFHIGEDGHPTAKIYYGQARTPSFGDPVAFALDK